MQKNRKKSSYVYVVYVRYTNCCEVPGTWIITRAFFAFSAASASAVTAAVGVFSPKVTVRDG